MPLKRSIFGLAFLFTISCKVFPAKDYKYEIEYLETDMYTPCEKYPDNFVDKLFDLSNLNYELLEDNRLLVQGYFRWTVTPEEPVQMRIELLKKQRGTWNPTAITIHRPDLCAALIDPTEEWYQFFQSIPEEQRICPVVKDNIMEVDYVTDAAFNFLMPNLDGEYNLHTEFDYKNGSSQPFACAEIFVHLYSV